MRFKIAEILESRVGGAVAEETNPAACRGNEIGRGVLPWRTKVVAARPHIELQKPVVETVAQRVAHHGQNSMQVEVAVFRGAAERLRERIQIRT